MYQAIRGVKRGADFHSLFSPGGIPLKYTLDSQSMPPTGVAEGKERMKIRLNEAQIRTICESYIVGSPEGTINYVEIEVDDHELATDCNGYSEVIELTIDERDYYSRDLIGPTGSVSGLQYLDRREAEKDEIADMARIVQEEEDLHAADEAGQ